MFHALTGNEFSEEGVGDGYVDVSMAVFIGLEMAQNFLRHRLVP